MITPGDDEHVNFNTTIPNDNLLQLIHFQVGNVVMGEGIQHREAYRIADIRNQQSRRWFLTNTITQHTRMGKTTASINGRWGMFFVIIFNNQSGGDTQQKYSN